MNFWLFKNIMKHSKLSFAMLLFLLITTTISVKAQQSSVTLTNNYNQPIFLAHIKFTSISGVKKGQFKWVVSDQNGKATNPFTDSTLVEISFVGYKKTSTILAPQESKTISLKKDEFNLNEFVVSANFIPIEIENSTYQTQVIDEETINEKGANNLRESLNNELNFKTNNGHVNETAINLNGLSGNHVKFMVDGVPIEGRLNGNIDLSQINVNEVEKIEIIEGPTSVAYGTNALGGVINIITKKQQSKNLNIGLKSYYESVGQYNFSGKIGWKVKRNLFKISGGRNFFSGYANPDTSRYKDWKPREQYFGSFMFSKPIKHLKLTYVFDGFTELMTSRGKPRAPYNVTAFDTHYKTHRFSNKLLLNGRVTKNHFIDFTASQSYFKRTRNIFFKDLTTLEETITPSDNDQDTTTFYNYLARAVFSSKNDSVKVNYMLGTELKNDQIIAERVKNYEQQISDYAFFGHLKIQPTKYLTIQPAVRYAYNSKYTAPIVPSINILINSTKTSTIRASYAKGFRAPSLKELYLEFHFNSTINLYGNENLNSENSDHFNLAIDWKKETKNQLLHVSPRGFYSKINNLIFLSQTSPIDWTYTNVNHFITQGAALNINYSYKNFSIETAASYYGNYNSQFSNITNNNKFFYSNDVIAGPSYSIDSLGLKFNLSYKYTGKINNYYIDDNNVLHESYIGDYHTFDASIRKYFMNNKIMLVGGVKNIFDVTQVEMQGDVYGVSNSSEASRLNVLWGRSYFVSLNITF